MARTKTPTANRSNKKSKTPTTTNSVPASKVLTLAEAAAYLRISPEELLKLVSSEGLPGRRVGADWRFLKSALQNWLITPPKGTGLLSQLGALKDDPYLDELLKEIYKQRGRPMTEEG